MLEQACKTTAASNIRYERADLEALDLPGGGFDLAYSSLALHYIKDLPGLFANVHAALKPGAHFVFSIEHPIFMAPRNPGWIIDAEGRKSWPVDAYQNEGERVTNWLAEGVIKQHRTIGTLLNMLIAVGFSIRHVNEWGPSNAEVAAQPALAEERERPMMMLVGVQH